MEAQKAPSRRHMIRTASRCQVRPFRRSAAEPRRRRASSRSTARGIHYDLYDAPSAIGRARRAGLLARPPPSVDGAPRRASSTTTAIARRSSTSAATATARGRTASTSTSTTTWRRSRTICWRARHDRVAHAGRLLVRRRDRDLDRGAARAADRVAAADLAGRRLRDDRAAHQSVHDPPAHRASPGAASARASPGRMRRSRRSSARIDDIATCTRRSASST